MQAEAPGKPVRIAQMTSAGAAQNIHVNELRSTTDGAAVSSGLRVSF